MFIHKKINQIICFIIVFIFAILIQLLWKNRNSLSSVMQLLYNLVGEHPIKNN